MPENSDDYDPDPERVQERARERQHDHTDTVEDMLGRVGLMEEEKYPVTGEELATEYGEDTMALPNETESLGSVFDRLTDARFESPDEVREAVANELTGEAGPPDEYNDERALDELNPDEERL